MACGSASPPPAGNTCTAGAACSSTNACHTASISCGTGSPVCTDTGNVPDGTNCGGTSVCTAGVCSAPPAKVAVVVSPKTATVVPGGTAGFTAIVSGSSNTALTWTVQESGGGTVTSSGVYTAPATVGGPFHVVATSVADGTKSDTAAVTVAAATAVPAAPAGLVALSGCKSITLQWKAAADASSYVVKRSTTAGGTFTAIAATPAQSGGTWSVTDTDASFTDHAQFFYQVFAHNSAGDSAPSTITGTTGLSAPRFVDSNNTGGPPALYAGDTQISMAWDSSGVTGAPTSPTFTIARGASASGPFTVVKSGYPSTSFTDVGLTVSTSYFYQVQLDGAAPSCPTTSPQATTGAAGSAIVQGPAAATLTTVTEKGGVATTFDLTWLKPFALDAAFAVHRGIATADGRFTIPDVPTGFNQLALGNALQYTDARVFDLSDIVFGRADAVDPAKSTQVTVSVMGLQPWNTATDSLELFALGGLSTQNGSWLFPTSVTGATGVPAAGATTASVVFEALKNLALLQSSKGDVVYLNDQADVMGAPYHYVAPVKSCVAQLNPADMADGTPETIGCPAGAALTAPPTSSASIDWPRSQFDPIAKAAAPPQVTPTLASESFAILEAVDDTSGAPAFKYGLASFNWAQPGLAFLELDTATTDLKETITLYNPYPAKRFSPFYFASLDYNIPYTAPATVACPTPTAGSLRTYVRKIGPVADLASQIVPDFGAPGTITHTKLAPITGGAPVQISWSAPATGPRAPTSYLVSLRAVKADASCATTVTTQAEIWTTAAKTSVTFAPTGLVAGGSYVATVRALYLPDDAPNLTRPLQLFNSTHTGGTWKASDLFTY